MMGTGENDLLPCKLTFSLIQSPDNMYFMFLCWFIVYIIYAMCTLVWVFMSTYEQNI